MPVGYVLICAVEYLGFVEYFKYCAKTGAAPDPPLLKKLVQQSEIFHTCGCQGDRFVLA